MGSTVTCTVTEPNHQEVCNSCKPRPIGIRQAMEVVYDSDRQSAMNGDVDELLNIELDLSWCLQIP
jgi:hypothetical protein